MAKKTTKKTVRKPRVTKKDVDAAKQAIKDQLKPTTRNGKPKGGQHSPPGVKEALRQGQKGAKAALCICGDSWEEGLVEGYCGRCGGVFDLSWLCDCRKPTVSQPEQDWCETCGGGLVDVAAVLNGRARPVKRVVKQLPKKSNLDGLLQKRDKPPQAPHLVIKAFAGTGKTFTSIMGVAWAFAKEIWPDICERLGFEVRPSEEQQAVWDSFALSARAVSTVTYCAFNKSIVNEFAEKWGWLVEMLQQVGVTLRFATVNSLGNQSVYRSFGRLKPDKHALENRAAEVIGRDPREIEKSNPGLLGAIESLGGMVKLTLTGWDEVTGFDSSRLTDTVLEELASRYDIDLANNRELVYRYLPEVLDRCLDPKRNGEIDFNDQNWLPVVLNLGVSVSDFLIVDEAQDLPRCKQEFCLRIGERISIVGDSHQAIYGFAGADTESIPRMEKLLGVNHPVQVLRLTETRRCGKAIVREAQQYVPDFQAHESNPDGLIRRTSMEKYAADTNDGDMLLCRVNAPLVSQALRFLKAGRKVIIRGRDFGGQLVSFIKKMDANSVEDLVAKIEDWYRRECKYEQAKSRPSEAKLMALADKKECLEAFCEGADTVGQILDKIGLVFAGKECPHCKRHYSEDALNCYNRDCPQEHDPVTGYNVGPKLVTPRGVLLSSVHRAKGLESNRVFILQPPGATMPHPMAKSAWQQEQEMNCLYIAVTRAIHELVYVS